MQPVIEAKNLGVEFFRSRRRQMSLREIVFKRRNTAPRDTFWALKDVSFTVAKGEAVGLIGGNGGGKSTLLKMIAGTLIPDEGAVKVRGGVAPLIELTGGFLGELSGRDNVYLAAGLHGLSKRQIDERYDEIVDFAGPQVRDAMDQSFRHYSSGMKVRLAFGLITTIDQPVVLVDEVLAVGDRAFRERCYVRMENMLAGGKTLFLVSHSEPDLKRFAERGLYLKSGRLAGDGSITEMLEQYHHESDDS